MNDEANTDYESIIDQMTQGHMWLFERFGIKPRIGWHIGTYSDLVYLVANRSFWTCQHSSFTIRSDGI
jgi:hypothetical protein